MTQDIRADGNLFRVLATALVRSKRPELYVEAASMFGMVTPLSREVSDFLEGVTDDTECHTAVQALEKHYNYGVELQTSHRVFTPSHDSFQSGCGGTVLVESPERSYVNFTIRRLGDWPETYRVLFSMDDAGAGK